jgi:hypothetical protein
MCSRRGSSPNLFEKIILYTIKLIGKPEPIPPGLKISVCANFQPKLANRIFFSVQSRKMHKST